MSDREKVIQHFEDALGAYGNERMLRFVMADILEVAITLLKEQEPRLMTLEEVKAQKPDEDTDDNWVWIEYAGGCCRLIHIVKFHSLVCAEFPQGHSKLHYMHTAPYGSDPRIRQLLMNHVNLDTYGITWRCWNARPTEQQREATPWEK